MSPDVQVQVLLSAEAKAVRCRRIGRLFEGGFAGLCPAVRGGQGLQRHIGIVVFPAVGDVLIEPGGGKECLCGFPAAEFHFRYGQRREGRVEDVQLNGQGIVRGRAGQARRFQKAGMGQRDEVTFFGDNPSVRFAAQMVVSIAAQRQVALLPGHHAVAFVGQIVFLVFFADAHYGRSVQVGLFDVAERVAVQVGRQFSDGEFAFYFHRVRFLSGGFAHSDGRILGPFGRSMP